jgi:hypothetical protein
MTYKPLFNLRILRREVEKHVARGHGAPKGTQELIQSWSRQISAGMFARYSETQIEQAFNSTLFEKILGYVPLGRGLVHHIIPKRSSQGGHNIPDFVLGTFNPAANVERWRVVGEIKSLNVNLDLPQTSRRNPETPVQQAFRYALRGQQGVEWIIVTNFSEIRLYRNGHSVTYHRWTLEELGEGVRLDEFYVLLRREHIAPDQGEPETLRILNESLHAGMALTEGFYGLYDLARQKLIDALRIQPAFRKASEIDVYGKAHKLLNRVLFAAFCEDHPSRLLPAGTLERLHTDAAKRGKKGAYWETFQRFFRDLDRGSPPGSAHAYNAFNGGLFAPDPMLDNLRLPDELFVEPIFYRGRRRESRAINGIFGFHAYDFSEELDVDSLGAIFEQSLKDLPHVAHAVRGQGTTSITRREATGVYYTPPAITRFLVARALTARLNPIKASILADIERTGSKTKRKVKVGKRALTADELRDVQFQEQLLERLKTITFADPACGSGAFLVEALVQFHNEYERVNAALGQLMGAEPLFGLDRMILRNNLHGADILGESAEIAKLSIWLRTAAPNEPLEKLDTAITCADSLRENGSGPYDLVVSNPPWGAELAEWSDTEISTRFPACGQERDTYALFLIRGYELLKPGGVLAYIMPNSWLTVEGYAPLRKWVLEHFQILEIVNVWKIFKDVNHDACLFIARRPEHTEDGGLSSKNNLASIECLTRGTNESAKAQRLAEEHWHQSFMAAPEKWSNETNCRYETTYEPAIARELDRVASRSSRLGTLCDITVGIQVYHRRKVPDSVIKNREFHSTRKNGRDFHPYIDGNEVQRYFQAPSDSAYLLYSDKLCDKRELQHYAQPRILVQQIFWQRLSACLSEPEEPVLYLNTLFSITTRDKDVDLGYILAVLNSRLVSAAYERWTNRLFGDKFPKISKLDLARLPIPQATRTNRAELSRLGRELGQQWSLLKNVSSDFSNTVTAADSSGNLAKSMARFWEMTKDDVLTELSRNPDVGQRSSLDRIFSSWKQAVKNTNRYWSKVCDLEKDCESLLCNLANIKPALYSEIVSRAPEVMLETILLPR